MRFTISKKQKKLRKVRDICAAFHKEDFGERGTFCYLQDKLLTFTIKHFNHLFHHQKNQDEEILIYELS